MINEFALMQFLDDHNFEYQRIEHQPVYSCDEANRLDFRLTAASTKNLFLCDKKELFFYLVITSCEKRLNFNYLAEKFGVTKLRFVPEDKLERILGVKQGAVTILGLMNDIDRQVELWIDIDTWNMKDFLCHPLVNTATLVLSKESLVRLLEMSGHTVNLFDQG